MGHRCIVSSPETFAIILAVGFRYLGMPILVAIIHVRHAVMIEILLGRFNAVMVSLR
jgi:hypothetical protein